MKFEFCCPTLFGLEGIVADELRFHGKLTDVRPENGKVYFSGDENTLVWANLWLRTAERVLIKVGEFTATSFEQLFEQTKSLNWSDYLPADANFPVKGHSLNSALYSIPDCQSIIKKAVVNNMSQKYKTDWFEEVGAKYQIQFSIMNDKVELFIDTSGAGLHKRGYRANSNDAPLRETLAAAMVKIARYKGRETFIDPFCGSGTIAIEAAMIAKNQAPGIVRAFAAEKWNMFDAKIWKDARNAAVEAVIRDKFPIFASDNDRATVELAMDNAKKARVGSTIEFTQSDARDIDYLSKTGTLITNPPYGERLLDIKSAQKLYRSFGKNAAYSPMKMFIISSDENFEGYFGVRADKKRKLYNGMIKCNLNMYFKDPNERKKATLMTDLELKEKNFKSSGNARKTEKF